jgi:competence protein ComEA
MPDLPFSPSRRQLLIAVAAGLVLLFGAGKLLRGSGSEAALAPPAAPPVETATAAATVVVVDVVGAVRRPGLYRLREGDRIADAVARAGGVGPKADLTLINLAAPLADGQQVVVPAHGSAASAAAAQGAAAAGPVHLNTATLEQLDSRQKHGSFASVDELDAVPGIGPARMEQLKDLVAP